MTDYELWESDFRSRMMDSAFPDEMMPCIERFLRDVDPMLKPGLDLYPEVFETDLFFPLQRQAEMQRMIQIARSVGAMFCKKCSGTGKGHCGPCQGTGLIGGPQTVMEIGADKGGGVYHWVKCLPSVKRMIACEIRGTPYQSAMSKAFPGVEFAWMQRSSLPAPYIGHGRIDVLFIDGDKSAFLQDFDAYLPLMNPKGVVFMHDINEPGSAMRRDFETVKARGYRTEEVIDTSDSEQAMARESHGIPSVNPHEAWLRHWRGRSCGVGVIYLSKG